MEERLEPRVVVCIAGNRRIDVQAQHVFPVEPRVYTTQIVERAQKQKGAYGQQQRERHLRNHQCPGEWSARARCEGATPHLETVAEFYSGRPYGWESSEQQRSADGDGEGEGEQAKVKGDIQRNGLRPR